MICKWNVEVGVRNPIGEGKILLVDWQGTPGYIQIWTQEDEGYEQTRKVDVLATGESVPSHYLHLGSTTAGPYVWHAYEVQRYAN